VAASRETSPSTGHDYRSIPGGGVDIVKRSSRVKVDRATSVCTFARANWGFRVRSRPRRPSRMLARAINAFRILQIGRHFGKIIVYGERDAEESREDLVVGSLVLENFRSPRSFHTMPDRKFDSDFQIRIPSRREIASLSAKTTILRKLPDPCSRCSPSPSSSSSSSERSDLYAHPRILVLKLSRFVGRHVGGQKSSPKIRITRREAVHAK